MTKLSVFEKHSGLRSSLKNNLYSIDFPLEMKKYVEAALVHLCCVCEEEVQEVPVSSNLDTHIDIMTYNEFCKRYYEMFKDYEEKLIILNGPDFDMMKMIYQDWRDSYPNTNPLTYCNLLQFDLEKKLQDIKRNI